MWPSWKYTGPRKNFHGNRYGSRFDRFEGNHPGEVAKVRSLARPGYLQTGQDRCYDESGQEIACPGSGQDGEYRRGVPWPEPRFKAEGDVVEDRLTGLSWTRDAGPAEFPLSWGEAFDWVRDFNRRRGSGYQDWRLPNRRELYSLLSFQDCRPALPAGHPFVNVFGGWYWSSTTAVLHPAHAWYVNLAGARMFYGGKDQSFMVWPVRGRSRMVPATGQKRCYAENKIMACAGSGQDGESRWGRPWPEPRFHVTNEGVQDRLTGLVWQRDPGRFREAVRWREALEIARAAKDPWRLPNINELESLVDCDAAQPALPAGHPFVRLHDIYWSSTTSAYETDWAWALYLDKGAVGVGHKPFARFHVWLVCDGDASP